MELIVHYGGVLPDKALDMALLDCLGPVMARCAHSNSLHYLGGEYVIISATFSMAHRVLT